MIIYIIAQQSYDAEMGWGMPDLQTDGKGWRLVSDISGQSSTGYALFELRDASESDLAMLEAHPDVHVVNQTKLGQGDVSGVVSWWRGRGKGKPEFDATVAPFRFAAKDARFAQIIPIISGSL